MTPTIATTPPIPWRHTLAGLLLASVALLGLTLDATAGPGQRDKLDRHLREHTSQAADTTPFRVIVTLKPGAKRHYVNALKAACAPDAAVSGTRRQTVLRLTC
jgi:hypothetical protein